MRPLLRLLVLLLLLSAATQTPPARLVAQSPNVYLPLVVTPAYTIAYAMRSSAYDDRTNIAIVRTDGTGSKILTNFSLGSHALEPAWSPNGELIAFVLHETKKSAIYVMRADGSHQQVVWSTSDTQYLRHYRFKLVWSPDGRRIIFTGERFSHREITMLTIASGQHIILAAGDWPQWSPDGNTILFTSAINGISFVSTIQTDETQSRTLAPGYYPVWSPDGRQITYSANLSTYNSEKHELMLMNADGSSQHRIFTSTKSGGFFPLWSPKNSFIFALLGDTTGIIITPDGNVLRQFNVFGGDPELSPDGRWLATWGWVAIKATDIRIAQLDVTGQTLLQFGDYNDQRLPVAGAIVYDPAWQPFKPAGK